MKFLSSIIERIIYFLEVNKDAYIHILDKKKKDLSPILVTMVPKQYINLGEDNDFCNFIHLDLRVIKVSLNKIKLLAC